MTRSSLGDACASPPPVCALMLVLALLAGCGKSEQQLPQRPPAPVTVMTVAPRTIPYTQSFVAQTESSQQVDIVGRVSGFLDKIAYQEGELVKAGQVLFQLDPKPFQAQLQSARGGLQSQQARLTTARANLSRIKPLAEQNALSQSDLDKAQGEFDAAKAAVFSAEAAVTEAELNLGYTTIRSPVTGLDRPVAAAARCVHQLRGCQCAAHVRGRHRSHLGELQHSRETGSGPRELIGAGALVTPPNKIYTVEVALGDGGSPQTGPINFADPSFSLDTGSSSGR